MEIEHVVDFEHFSFKIMKQLLFHASNLLLQVRVRRVLLLQVRVRRVLLLQVRVRRVLLLQVRERYVRGRKKSQKLDFFYNVVLSDHVVVKELTSLLIQVCIGVL